MTFSEQPNYYDLLSSKDFLEVAILAYKNDDFDEMWSSLKKAVYHAVRFDSNPNYEVSKANFLSGLVGNFYNGNAGASKYLINKMQTNFLDLKDDPQFQNLIDKINNIKTN